MVVGVHRPHDVGRQLTTLFPMNTSLPTQRVANLWEEGPIPTLKMVEEEQTAYFSERWLTEVPAAQPAPRSAAARATVGRRSQMLRSLWACLLILTLAVLAHQLITRFVISPVVIQGRSMAPTLQNGEYHLLNRWVYLFRSPERGDLVVLRDPGHSDLAVKRIIAKPGDWVNLREGKVFLNGRRLNEPYLDRGVMTFPQDNKEHWVQLGRNSYYVMGDNRPCSEDSRAYGSIVQGNILGTIQP